MKPSLIFLLYIFSSWAVASTPVSAGEVKSACGDDSSTLSEKQRERLLSYLSFETHELSPVSSIDPTAWLLEAHRKSRPDQPPPETVAVLVDVVKPNMIRRSVFRTCDGSAYYFLDRGGVVDQFLWSGPITASTFSN
jgi:hypothetical protein